MAESVFDPFPWPKMASDIGVDFFQADERNFWTLLLCRTGSADMNTRICSAAIARGQT